MRRRDIMGAMATPLGMMLAGQALGAVASPTTPAPAGLKPAKPPIRLKGTYRQGLTRMLLGAETSIEDCCRIAASLGASGLDFFSDPADWPTLKRHGLICSMYRPDFGGGKALVRPPPGPTGWNAIGMPEARGDFLIEFHKAIDLAADHGIPNIILLAGTRMTVSYEQGAENAVAFCNLVKGHAEQRGVTLCMELINSTGVGGPPMSLFDHGRWGFDVVRKVGSPRVKVLYDLFHAQIMDGNIIKTVTDNFDLIGHFHVGGVPGRHEIDETQELNYRLVAKTIAGLGYRGFVTHEWSPAPSADPLKGVIRSMAIMDV